jgi:deoxyribodipyrimidine photolyase-related protein
MQLLFADQLGPHFSLGGPVLLPEVLGQFAKRRYHRQKAHLILSAVRHRALEADATLVKLEGYRDLANHPELTGVINPTSFNQRALVDALVDELGIEVSPARGFVATEQEFAEWAPTGRLRLEDFYRKQRLRTGLLMEGAEPAGGRWNYDADNRLPPPKAGLPSPPPWQPVEDEIDAQVRRDLDELERSGKAVFAGEDGPRLFPVTRDEAVAAAEWFIAHRLADFGPYEDAVLKGNWAMAHSLLSPALNLGLLDPLELARMAEQAYLAGNVPISSAEGFIRQLIGWRDYVWHLYWHFGPDYQTSNALNANRELPQWWRELDHSAVDAACVSHSLEGISKRGWLHHIERLMILGNFALQRGLNPQQVNDWFIDNFVDGTPWVMPANVIGMSLFADGGKMSTKPYAAGGAYISKMTDHCGGCRFDPKVRVGPNACPITAGYWLFVGNNLETLSGNHRMWQAVSGFKRLRDSAELMANETDREKF